MKDSGIEWIGEIPEDWDVVRNKNIFNRKKEIIENEWKNTQLLSLTTKGIIKKDISILEGKLPESFSTYQFVNKGDLVLCLFDLDMSAVFNGYCQYDGMISPAYKRYVLKAEGDLRYYNYLFDFIFDKRKYKIYSTTLRFTLDNQEFDRIPTIKPNLKQQIEIANFLDRKTKQIEDIKNTIKNEIENLENYKKSVITESVTKGLDKNVEMKDSGIEWIGEIPKHWKIIRLKYGLTEKMKYGASEEGVEFSESLPRYIRITDIDQNGNLKSTGKQSLPENKSVGYILEDNTVLFARSGATVGKTFLYKKEYGRSAYAGYLIAAKTNNIILLGIWLYYFTFSDAYYNWTRQMFSQSTIQNINAEKYSNMPLPITGISNQLKIIDYLNKKTKLIDDSIAIKQKQLETLEEYKKSLIYEYVTGKKEVKDGEGT